MWIWSALNLICISFLILENRCHAQSNSTGNQTIAFECSKDGKITNVLGDKKQYTFVDNQSYCILSDINCDWENKTKIDIIYSPNENDTEILGGKGALFYELECKGPLDFYAEANASFAVESVKPTAFIHKTITASTISKTLSLYIKKGSSVVSKVKIGDELSLTMQGPNGYEVLPSECKAFPVANGNVLEYLLWTNTTCKSKDVAVMEDTWTYSTNRANVKMFAFRFVKSDQVRIVCSAHLCPTATCTSTCKGVQQGRKKRNADLKPMINGIEETASATFTVIDGSVTLNGCPGLPINLSILAAVTFVMFIFV